MNESKQERAMRHLREMAKSGLFTQTLVAVSNTTKKPSYTKALPPELRLSLGSPVLITYGNGQVRLEGTVTKKPMNSGFRFRLDVVDYKQPLHKSTLNPSVFAGWPLGSEVAVTNLQPGAVLPIPSPNSYYIGETHIRQANPTGFLWCTLESTRLSLMSAPAATAAPDAKNYNMADNVIERRYGESEFAQNGIPKKLVQCTDCKGSGKYQGLLTIEDCKKCSGRGEHLDA